MTRRFLIFFILICLFSASVNVCADIVMGNNFRYKNENKILKSNRSSFVANGPDGFVTIKDEPGSKTDMFQYIDNFFPGIRLNWENPEKEINDIITYKNGEKIFIDGLFIHNGEYWGIMKTSHYTRYPGWIPMEQLLTVYTPKDFEEENKNSYYEYTGSYDAVFAAKRIVFWQWPGSDREKRVVDNEKFVLKNVNTFQAYRDSEGREWGYVKLIYNNTGDDKYTSMPVYEAWICLTDPSNSNIPFFCPAALPAKWSHDDTYEWTHIKPPDTTALQYSLSNITKVKTYEPNKTFTDIDENAWYKNAVSTAYEYGMTEELGNRFDPDDHSLLGEAIVIASQIHAYYKYGKDEGKRLIDLYYIHHAGGSGWMLGALTYCEVEELIKKYEFVDYYSPATRTQMVHAFSKILQPKDMPKLNTVIKLPDVNKDTNYSDDIILFYEAGIIGGVDADGTFNPNDRITRAEAAAIFTNLIDVSKRHSGRTFGN